MEYILLKSEIYFIKKIIFLYNVKFMFSCDVKDYIVHGLFPYAIWQLDYVTIYQIYQRMNWNEYKIPEFLFSTKFHYRMTSCDAMITKYLNIYEITH